MVKKTVYKTFLDVPYESGVWHKAVLEPGRAGRWSIVRVAGGDGGVVLSGLTERRARAEMRRLAVRVGGKSAHGL